MTAPEITALAREYAEEQCKKSTMIDTSNLYEDKLLEFYDVYGFLLRRYCLAEKSKVESTYNRIWNEWNFSLDAENKANSKFILSALESLFPEIEKEVEL